MKYAAKISYDGSKFYGWQIQPELPTVQEYLEKGFTKINKDLPVAVAGAGRTDAGVHAVGQVCSFEMTEDWDTGRMLLAINANIPDGMSVMEITKVPEDFHARFDAKEREYRYFIWNSSSIYPHLAPVTCWIKQRCYNWERAAEACKYLEGEHDFGSFCRQTDRPENAVRTMHSVSLEQRGELIVFRVVGSGFLTNMVRIMVGNLEQIARGVHEPEWIKELYEDRSVRSDGGRTFPAGGLFLWNINYDIPLWKLHQNAFLM